MTEKERFQEQLSKEGYSNEEKYFYELNRELIGRQKVQLDLIRKNQNEKLCPKCGSTLAQSDAGGFNHLQCIQCKGVFLESLELENLMKQNQSEHLVQKMKKLFLPRPDYHPF
jgi:Zn-finger nucleic acid-binding protein